MNDLGDLIGRELEMAAVGRAIRTVAEGFNLRVVGAHLVTCSDETEGQCADVFQRTLVQSLLPPLKTDCRFAFRTANLGARYEPGSIRVAEDHFATPSMRETTKLMVVKLNAHVAVLPTADGLHYGRLERYGSASACCGVLATMMEGGSLPAVAELTETFASGGCDRLAELLNPELVEPSLRALAAAVANAALQVARAVEEIVEHVPETPTIYLVLPCVTINRAESDTEVVVGQYGVDWTGTSGETRYRGLGSEPAQYRIRHEGGRLVIEDHQWPGEAAGG